MEQLLTIIKIDFVLFLIVVAFVKLMKFLGKGLRFSEIFISVHKWYKMKKIILTNSKYFRLTLYSVIYTIFVGFKVDAF